MGPISETKLELVKGLIEQAPDTAVRSLLLALSADGGHDGGLTRVQHMVEVEAADRRARNLVFAPIAPLCGARSVFTGLRFPASTLGLLWKGLKAAAPEEVAAASAICADPRSDEDPSSLLDALCVRAATGLRGGEEEFAAAAAAADQGGGREVLATALGIASMVRRALYGLSGWLGRMTSEKAAKLRLMYRDVATIADDAGPLFFDMLGAHLAEPWMILHIISGVMDRPNEAYFSASELAIFGLHVLADIDEQLAEVTSFNGALGRKKAVAAAHAAHTATLEMSEVEQSLSLTHEGAWGKRLAQQKRDLAAAVESHLRSVDGSMGLALPLQTVRLGPRAARGVPRLTQDPDPGLVEKAASLLVFMHEARASAAAGGFAASWAKAHEALEIRLDSYVEDILEEIRSDHHEHRGRARAYLDVAAELCGLVRDEKAAQIVRRRAAAA
jgi:hypothetical protein